MSRRAFLGATAAAALYPAVCSLAAEAEPDECFVRPARAWTPLADQRVRCDLCFRQCTVPPAARGFCGVRQNRRGSYYTLVHSRACALNVDPIEKKPLFHFLPGSDALSVATPGCNLECKFCQNWDISQRRPEQVRCNHVPPERLIALAAESNARIIAYTYSEPIVFYEYVFDTARLGCEKGIRSVMISNGTIQREPMKALCEHLSAVKIDLKGFTEKFYREVCSARLQPVLDTLSLLAELKKPTEIVTLLIPGLNDNDAEIRGLSQWVVKNLGPDVPLHFTRFTPMFRMKNHAPTPVKTLERAWDLARAEGVRYVYVGNVPGHAKENTCCHQCGCELILRYGFVVRKNNLAGGKCPACGTTIPGVWS